MRAAGESAYRMSLAPMGQGDEVVVGRDPDEPMVEHLFTRAMEVVEPVVHSDDDAIPDGGSTPGS